MLDDLGISEDGRVATFAWNTARHLELYFAAPCTGRVLHTLNIRLFPEQLDLHRQPRRGRGDLRRPVAARRCCGRWSTTFETVRHIVVMDDGKGEVPEPRRRSRPLHDYEDLLAAADAGRRSTSTTRTGPRRCATRAAPPATRRASSTPTARRSCTRWARMTADEPRRAASPTASCRSCRCSTPTPGAWPTPPWPAGANLVHARARTCRRPAIAELIEEERVTVAAGVPTIWMGVLPELKGRDTSALRAIPCGGSAVPRALSEAYREQIGLPIMQAWGMTETSPIASVGRIKSTLDAELDDEDAPTCAPPSGSRRSASTSGSSTRARIEALPWDGESSRRAAGARARGSRRRTTTTTARPSRSPTTAG